VYSNHIAALITAASTWTYSFIPEDGDGIFFRNVGINLQKYRWCQNAEVYNLNNLNNLHLENLKNY